jgi:hypothetical protein
VKCASLLQAVNATTLFGSESGDRSCHQAWPGPTINSLVARFARGILDSSNSTPSSTILEVTSFLAMPLNSSDNHGETYLVKVLHANPLASGVAKSKAIRPCIVLDPIVQKLALHSKAKRRFVYPSTHMSVTEP